ncbi:anaerobic ribonucleoside-triphosphate reductase activating protein [Marinilactibacillus psychrotolerans]|uniref:Anaerobic ribonucleoside-triphosphate reductase-activating protein n=2 Tax=Marinilactibacillus psychrotolerans TaxID=191770 RepID=A0A511H4D5_9LACT|nr:anaerobic ribonucleoside-triphosphate reductase activating protein [Marinilactibacillus psychrotolerans]TLQ06310.1 anaerobic ribonucleoside-triphosphate reductase activating protein [Marinilactibacillus psychrotolerans]SDD13507.1 anaerobic ribonucleoside-triphosphate reductase activating protein [Marinilactibacillus psychrotolerans]SJN45691.1 Ribonucleotide reductase of class III (anaerobic), activating protein [Marinilactibacillus psychrotolerans 42ea]GEL67649.1 anaerobic ribonucleoside-tri
MAIDPVAWTSDQFSKHYIADYKPYNFVDGEGVRCSIYVSGCPFACKGCYNKAAQNFTYGKPYSKELEDRIVEDLKAEYCQGLTLLGGEPFLNTGVTIQLCRRIRQEFGFAKDIWSWTGYTWDELMRGTEDKQELLTYLDVIVDGRFELDKKDLSLAFRGSSNQKIIDVQQSLKTNTVKLWHNGDYK